MGYGFPGTMEATAGMGESSLQAVGILEPAFQAWAPGEQCSNAVGRGEPSLWVVGAQGPTCKWMLPGAMIAAPSSGKSSLRAEGVLGHDCWSGLPGAQYSGAAASLGEPSLQVAGVLGQDCWLRRTKLVGSRSSGAWLLHGLQGAQYSGAAASSGNQVCWLAPSVTHGAAEPWVLLTQGCQFPGCFRVKAADHVVKGSMELSVPVCTGK
jgi:hypothetical protein